MLDIKVTVRNHLPLFKKRGRERIPFEHIAHEILPKEYELSLVICADALARRLNRAYRAKGGAANVLSFPLGDTEGEVFLNVRTAAREARSLRVSSRYRIIHLFIHGLLHLKGLRHGRTMERTEEKLLRAFSS